MRRSLKAVLLAGVMGLAGLTTVGATPAHAQGYGYYGAGIRHGEPHPGRYRHHVPHHYPHHYPRPYPVPYPAPYPYPVVRPIVPVAPWGVSVTVVRPTPYVYPW